MTPVLSKFNIQNPHLQSLFERMADESDKLVSLITWENDSCVIKVQDPQVQDWTVLLTWYPNFSDVPLVMVQSLFTSLNLRTFETDHKIGPTVYVSPIPSAVLAVICR